MLFATLASVSLPPLQLPSGLLAFGLPGHGEWIILLILGLLIFGRRLPEVGRSLGRGIVEFKKGIKGIEEEVEEESSKPSRRVSEEARRELPREEPRSEATASRERAEPEDSHATVGESRGED